MQLKTLAFLTLFLFGASTLTQAYPPAPGQAETIATFNYGYDTPESVTTDYYGNVYVSLLLTAEIVKIDPHTGSVELYEQFDPAYQLCTPDQVPGVTGIWINPLTKVMYANVNTCDPATKGVYKIPNDGTAPVLLATVPMPALLNGIVKRGDMLYSTDSFSMTGAIYATSIWGNGSPADILVEDPLIAFDPTIPPPPGIPFMPGPNGIQKYHGDLYVGHSGKNIIIRIPMRGYGPGLQVGVPEVFVDVLGVDDFAFDTHGNVLFTNDPYCQLGKVTPEGETTILLTAEDGLNGSTAAAFGRLFERRVLFVTSAAFPFMPPPYNNGQAPNLKAYGYDIPGYPLR
jgi:hypothetical protein